MTAAGYYQSRYGPPPTATKPARSTVRIALPVELDELARILGALAAARPGYPSTVSSRTRPGTGWNDIVELVVETDIDPTTIPDALDAVDVDVAWQTDRDELGLPT